MVVGLYVFVLFGGFAQPRPAEAAINRIWFAGKNIYLNGVNTPWNDYGQDFGCNYSSSYFETMFTNMQAYGVNSTRVWVHTDGRCSPTFNSSGVVTGLPANFYSNLDDFLTRAKNHHVAVILVLWAHELDGRFSGVDRTDLILNNSRTDAYINNVLTPMVQRYANNPAILAWEVFNEPDFLLPNEQASNRTVVPPYELQRFIGRLAATVHRNSDQYVTVGAAMYKYNCDRIGSNPPDNGTCFGNYWSDSNLQSASGDSEAYLDFYQVHYYNWQAPYWSFWTSSGPDYYLYSDKPVIIGEWGIDANQGKSQFLNDTYNANYAGAIAWSYWYDPCCGGGWDDIKNELKAFRDAHPNEVDINLNNSGSAPDFNTSASASPASLSPGGATTITATVANTGGALSNSIVDVEIYNSSGTQIAQTYWSGQGFSANQTRNFTWNWTAPSNLAAGTYSIAVGVFDSTWGTNYEWNGQAGTLTISSSSGSGNTRTGSWAGRLVTSGNWKSMVQFPSGLATNSSYTASIYHKGSGSFQLRVHAGQWGGDLATATCNASGSWQQCSVSFNTGGNSQVTFRLTDSNSGGTTIYLDDAVLSSSGGGNVLSNSSFESGNSSWTVESPFAIVNNP
jgi:hypothetical protein